MLILLALLVLLVLLFGGLGVFVAKIFFLGLLVALLIGVVSGGLAFRGLGGRNHDSDAV